VVLSLKLVSFDFFELAQPRSELSLYLGRKKKVAVAGVGKGREFRNWITRNKDVD